MNMGLALLGAVAAVGTGYVIGKKLVEKNPEAVAAVKQNCSEKFKRASVYCAGAVKTGSEKLAESVNAIISAGMEKSSEIAGKAKVTGQSFKNEIDNLKDMVVSINKGADVDIYDDEANFTFVEDGIEGEITELPEEGSEAL